jgi:hypothetical protein
MIKAVVGGMFGLLLFSSGAMAACTSYPYTLTNGTTADASQVMANFNCAAKTGGSTLDGTTFTGTSAFSGITNLNGTNTLSPNTTVTGASTIFTVASTSNGASDGIKFSAKNSTSSANIWTVGPNITQDNAFQFANGASSTVLMNVLSSGSVGIGVSVPSYTLHVNGSVAGTSAYNNLSDVRLKKNIREITDSVALVEKMRGVRFDWRAPDERTIGKDISVDLNKPQVGFIAQELREVLPESVSIGADKDQTLTVAESKVVPVLVEAIKELIRRNDAQARAISKMSGQIAELEARGHARTAQR